MQRNFLIISFTSLFIMVHGLAAGYMPGTQPLHNAMARVMKTSGNEMPGGMVCKMSQTGAHTAGLRDVCCCGMKAPCCQTNKAGGTGSKVFVSHYNPKPPPPNQYARIFDESTALNALGRIWGRNAPPAKGAPLYQITSSLLI